MNSVPNVFDQGFACLFLFDDYIPPSYRKLVCFREIQFKEY